MPACPHTSTCGLHRSISMKEALRVWQSFYCDGVFVRCERYKLAAAGRAVPDELLPNGRLIDPSEDDRPSRASTSSGEVPLRLGRPGA
ncbi:MAG TPA: hypothetical protein VFK90_09585 [Anaeromyxobacter sp.]|nr:hypothetical protein [Anaeromyxobacter sp.]